MLYSMVFFPTTSHVYLSASEFGQAEIQDGGTGDPPTRPCQDASGGTGWSEMSGSGQTGSAAGLPPPGSSVWPIDQPD